MLPFSLKQAQTFRENLLADKRQQQRTCRGTAKHKNGEQSRQQHIYAPSAFHFRLFCVLMPFLLFSTRPCIRYIHLPAAICLPVKVFFGYYTTKRAHMERGNAEKAPCGF